MHIIYSNINYYYLEIVSGKPKRNMNSKIYRVWRLECEKSVAEFKEVLITAEQQSLFLYVSINLKFQAKFCIDVQQHRKHYYHVNKFVPNV